MKDVNVAALFDAARNGTLPEDFDQWGVSDGIETVAHVAASCNNLPKGFDLWALQSEGNWSVAHEAAVGGYLPDDFDQWDLADCSGRTVAHLAASSGCLTDSFDQWHLQDETGWSVAHEAARWGRLPKGFNHWELVAQNGWTVAHEAALGGALSENVPDSVLRLGPGVRDDFEDIYELEDYLEDEVIFQLEEPVTVAEVVVLVYSNGVEVDQENLGSLYLRAKAIVDAMNVDEDQ